MARLTRGFFTILAAVAAGSGVAWLAERAEARRAAAVGGHAARSPAEMTVEGWRSIVARAARGFLDDRVTSEAASIAFYALLSLVPALSVLVSIYGLFTPPSSIPAQLAVFTSLLPEAARTLVEEQAIRLTSQSNGALSITLVISFGLAAWSANAAVKALFEAMNVIWGRRDTRSFVEINLESLLFTFTGILVATIMLITLGVIPSVMALLSVPPETELLLALVRWPLFYLTGLAAIVMLYRRGPCRPAPGWRWVLPGAIAAATTWVIASASFSWYVSTLATYPATYGSLATVVVVLTWLWLSAMILLAGGEIVAEIERQIGWPPAVDA
ncbi:YihY/virulence factor BrkB family protein [Siculibacillus lacustris]|nr:YihY/virulence factor BrkB family protein [Siculibacillus lacustris]